MKKAPVPTAIRRLNERDETSLVLSVVSIGEIENGILKLRASDARCGHRLAWVGKFEQRFIGRILPLVAPGRHDHCVTPAFYEQIGFEPLPLAATRKRR